MISSAGTPAARSWRSAHSQRSTEAPAATPGKRASKRRRSSSSTLKQHGPMLGPTTAPSEAAAARERRGRPLDDAVQHPAPAGVHGDDQGAFSGRRGDDDRHAIGVADDEAETRRGGEQRVGLGDRRREVAGAAPRLVLAHLHEVRAVDLRRHHPAPEVETDRGAEPAPVLEHRRGVVADREAEVQSGVGAGGHAAFAGREGGLDAGPSPPQPAQAAVAAPLAGEGPRLGLGDRPAHRSAPGPGAATLIVLSRPGTASLIGRLITPAGTS